MLRRVIILTNIILLIGCVPAMDKCIIAPPKNYSGDISTAQMLALNLSAFANDSVHANVESTFKRKAEQAFYAIPDKLIACHMLFQTIECRSRWDETGLATSQLITYIDKLCAESTPTAFSGEGWMPSATSEVSSLSQQALVRHNGFLDIVVLDSANKPQVIKKSWISCAADDNKQLMEHLRTSKLMIQINDCEKISLNFQIDGSPRSRWLVDAKQHQTFKQPLVQAGYSIIVNGTKLTEKDVEGDNEHANYIVYILRK